jgi:hypothetical protein
MSVLRYLTTDDRLGVEWGPSSTRRHTCGAALTPVQMAVEPSTVGGGDSCNQRL